MTAPDKIWASKTSSVYMDGSAPLTASTREFRNAEEYTRTSSIPNATYVAGLEAALRFYADAQTYETQYERMPCECCTDIFEPINNDNGEKARAALSARPDAPDT